MQFRNRDGERVSFVLRGRGQIELMWFEGTRTIERRRNAAQRVENDAARVEQNQVRAVAHEFNHERGNALLMVVKFNMQDALAGDDLDTVDECGERVFFKKQKKGRQRGWRAPQFFGDEHKARTGRFCGSEKIVPRVIRINFQANHLRRERKDILHAPTQNIFVQLCAKRADSERINHYELCVLGGKIYLRRDEVHDMRLDRNEPVAFTREVQAFVHVFGQINLQIE